MSRRYGRNQKRKAQALLQAVKSESQQQQLLYKARSAKLELRFQEVAAGYEAILELIRNTLGPASLMRVLATGEMPVIRSERKSPSGVPHEAVVPPKPIVLSGPSLVEEEVMFDVHELYDLISQFSGSFETQLVANVQYRSGIVCMALNQAAFRACPDHTLMSRISADLLKHLRKRT